MARPPGWDGAGHLPRWGGPHELSATARPELRYAPPAGATRGACYCRRACIRTRQVGNQAGADAYQAGLDAYHAARDTRSSTRRCRCHAAIGSVIVTHEACPASDVRQGGHAGAAGGSFLTDTLSRWASTSSFATVWMTWMPGGRWRSCVTFKPPEPISPPGSSRRVRAAAAGEFPCRTAEPGLSRRAQSFDLRVLPAR